MTGSSILEYVHRLDQQEVVQQFHLTPPTWMITSLMTSSPAHLYYSEDDECLDDSRATRASSLSNGESCDQLTEACLCVRIKSTLAKRGVHIKSAGYRVVQLCGRSRVTKGSGSGSVGSLMLAALVLPLPTLSELIVDSSAFVVRLGVDFSVLHCDSRMAEVTSLTAADDVIGRSLYQFCHVNDVATLRHAHVEVLNKGQTLSDYWRLLVNHSDGCVWLQSRATLVCNSKSHDDQHIVLVNYVISSQAGSNEDALSIAYNIRSNASGQAEADQMLLLSNSHRTHDAMTSLGTDSGDVTAASASQVTWGGSDVMGPRVTTVRDLERAMQRHLPTVNGHYTNDDNDHQLVTRRQRRRYHHGHVTSVMTSSSALLPASELLRTLHDAAVRRQQRGVICAASIHSAHYAMTD